MIGSVLIEEAELGDDMAGLFSKLKRSLNPLRGPVSLQVLRKDNRNPGPVPPYGQWNQWQQHNRHQNRNHHNKHRRGSVYPYQHHNRHQPQHHQPQGQTYPYPYQHQTQHNQGQGYPYQSQGQTYPYIHPQRPVYYQDAPVVSNRYADALDPLRRHYNPWGQRELSGFEGVWDSVSSFFTQADAKGAGSGVSLDRILDSAGKASERGLTIANGWLDMKAKADKIKAAKKLQAPPYIPEPIPDRVNASNPGGDPDKTPWLQKESIIPGVSNLVVVGGSAAALAMVLVLKKRR